MQSAHNCALCKNHGKWVPSRSHKRYCPWKECNCPKCAFTLYRRKVVVAKIACKRAMVQDMEREREMMRVESVDMIPKGKCFQNKGSIQIVDPNKISVKRKDKMFRIPTECQVHRPWEDIREGFNLSVPKIHEDVQKSTEKSGRSGQNKLAENLILWLVANHVYKTLHADTFTLAKVGRL